MKCIVLDAMGVIYKVGDDVVELLHPFMMEKGGTADLAEIGRIYIDISVGKMTSSEFWEAVGVAPELEDEYLQRHILNEGLIEFLEETKSRAIPVWCLSNDVSEWSRKLRSNFKIEGYFQGFIISGDVKLRKPDPAIYQLLIGEVKCEPPDITFVDDNVRNLDAAAELHIGTVLFNPSGKVGAGRHREVSSFKQLGELIR
jgi:putative hydrolase of the HAD superfamily